MKYWMRKWWGCVLDSLEFIADDILFKNYYDLEEKNLTTKNELKLIPFCNFIS